MKKRLRINKSFCYYPSRSTKEGRTGVSAPGMVYVLDSWYGSTRRPELMLSSCWEEASFHRYPVKLMVGKVILCVKEKTGEGMGTFHLKSTEIVALSEQAHPVDLQNPSNRANRLK